MQLCIRVYLYSFIETNYKMLKGFGFLLVYTSLMFPFPKAANDSQFYRL